MLCWRSVDTWYQRRRRRLEGRVVGRGVGVGRGSMDDLYDIVYNTRNKRRIDYML